MFTTSCRTTASPPKMVVGQTMHDAGNSCMHMQFTVLQFLHTCLQDILFFFYNFPMQPVEKKNVQESVVYERHNNFSISVE